MQFIAFTYGLYDMASINQHLIQQLKSSIKAPLPGRSAQYQMAHQVRQNHPPSTDNARIAAVLELLYPKDDEWHIVLIERESSNPNDRHGGQISFPGGGYEASDDNFQQTALREAWEEVGVIPEKVEIIGPLTNLYIPVSNFLVHPFLGVTLERPDFIPQASEVRKIIEAPLALLQEEATKKAKDLKLRENITLRQVPYFDVHGQVVWGATAMMLNELLALIE